jgi:hypothetical protein
MVPASFDRCRANLNFEASSAGTSIPSESLNPTARRPASAGATGDDSRPTVETVLKSTMYGKLPPFYARGRGYLS